MSPLPPPSDAPPVSLEVLAMLRGVASPEDPDFFRELVDTFLGDPETRVGELAATLRADRLDDVKALAHTPKGSSGNLGAEALSSLCKAMEDAARDRNEDEAAMLLARIVREAARVREFYLAERDRAA